MIRFLLTSWWLYIPIAGILLFLTFRNNTEIRRIKRENALRTMSPDERVIINPELTERKKSKFERLAKKLGLRGIFSHVFRKK
jgi:hypothetical protein